MLKQLGAIALTLFCCNPATAQTYGTFPLTEQDRQYIDRLDQQMQVHAPHDAVLYGLYVCRILDRTGSMEGVTQHASRAFRPSEYLVAVIAQGAAIEIYCPQFQYLLESDR